jgi:hypothetical protein
MFSASILYYILFIIVTPISLVHASDNFNTEQKNSEEVVLADKSLSSKKKGAKLICNRKKTKKRFHNEIKIAPIAQERVNGIKAQDSKWVQETKAHIKDEVNHFKDAAVKKIGSLSVSIKDTMHEKRDSFVRGKVKRIKSVVDNTIDRRQQKIQEYIDAKEHKILEKS